MNALLSSRCLASVAALGVLVASTTARAQTPAGPQPAAPAAPTAGPMPFAPGYPPGQVPSYPYPPGAYAPYAGAPMPWGQGTPVVETTRRSSTMMGIGIALMALGGTGVIIGSSMFAAGHQTEYYVDCFGGCDTSTGINDKTLKNGGIAVLAIGAAAIVAGLPLTIVGAQRIPLKSDAAAFLPEPHGNGLRWRF
ncbi:Hypothetical protein A7982_10722 [Minicystis rosea]|nr:Hypothetical protein A7982_10722 [Minicystis rosea]